MGFTEPDFAEALFKIKCISYFKEILVSHFTPKSCSMVTRDKLILINKEKLIVKQLFEFKYKLLSWHYF